LFQIYINDIADNLESLARVFADDTSLSYSSYSYQLLETKLNSDLVKINNWANTWLVNFNPNKRKVVFISNALPSDCINLCFQSSLLDSCGTHRHLGITFSENCKWASDIDLICSSVSKKISILRKLKFILNRNSLSKIDLTFNRHIMEYGCEVWNGCGVEMTDKLEKLQLKAAKIVTRLAAYASRDSLYLETGWEKLIDRRNRRCICLM
jgi:hypothetical protein